MTAGAPMAGVEGAAPTALEQTTGVAKKYLGFVGVVSLFINLAMLTVPIYMLQIYDRVLTSRNESTLYLLTAVALFLLLVLGILDFIRSRVLIRVGRWFDEELRTWLVHLAITTGRDSQSIRDLDEFRTFLTGPGLVAILDAPWTPVFVAAVFLLHPLLGMVALGGVVVLAALALLNELITRSVLSEAGAHSTRANRFSELVSRNAEAIRAMSMSQALVGMWEAERKAAIALQTQGSERASTIASVAKVLRLTLQLSVLGIGGWLAIREIVSPGVMIAASILAARALAPIEVAIGSWRNVISARNAYRRINGFLAEHPPAAQRMALPQPKGKLELERVSVMVPNRYKPILYDLNLALEPGEQLGITGPSAAGKSTLARTIVGVVKASAGTVRIDGFDLASWDPRQLGPHVGYVPQDVELFDGTVDQNIARFQQVDAEAVVRAARTAGVYDMIAGLPDGFGTHLGPGGENLSGGQRQRIALARALYGQPSLLVLDEPSSNLDTEGDHALRGALGRIRELGITVVLIAHRPNILTQVDKILVLDQGHVSHYGPTAEVLPKITRRVVSKGAKVSVTRRQDGAGSSPSSES